MRTKRLILFVFIVVLSAVCWAGLHIYTQQNKVTINASLFEVSQQFNKADKWKNWYPDSLQQYKIVPINAGLVKVKTAGKNSIDYLYATGLLNSNKTLVQWTSAATGFELLKQKLTNKPNNIPQALNNLKLLLENKEKRFGFLIKITPVHDTIILTKKAIVSPGKTNSKANELFKQLQQKIAIEHIPAEGRYHYVSYTATTDGNIEVAVGIAVHKPGITAKGFEFLKLPKEGRLLAGFYNGNYSDIKQLYAAMDKFVFEEKLKKVAQPLQQIQNTDTSLNANNKIPVVVYYPIF